MKRSVTRLNFTCPGIADRRRRILFICVHLCSSAVGFLSSCAPQPVPRAIIAPVPIATASTAPALAAARTQQSATAAVSAKLETQVNTLRQSASDLQDGMADAVLEADRLRQQKSATEAELNNLWQKLTDLNTRNLFLESETEAAVQFATEQKSLRDQAETGMAQLTEITADQEAELTAYRSQYETLSTAYATAEQARAALEESLQAAEKSAAIGDYLRRWLFGLVALIAAYFVIKLAMPRLGFP